MRPTNRRGTLLGAALAAASLAGAPTASAQTAATPPVAIGPYGMPIQEWQGLTCLYGGVIGGTGVFYYSDVLTAAVSGAANPLLLVPLIATGFLGGCTVGANAAPGFVWLYQHL
jgi:hypothetical protein